MKSVKWLIFLTISLLPVSYLNAANEIDIDQDLSNAPVDATPEIVPPKATTVLQPGSVNSTIVQKMRDGSTESLVLTPVIGQGVLKMKDVYEAGLSYYKKQDFARAIRYLSKALKIHDPYTPKFYYAEANVMLGVIYEFYIIDKKLAYQYYREALRIDPKTVSARKHIREVSKN